MTIINNKYDEKEVKNAIEKALSDFYNALLANLNKLQIRDIMKSKNPYLYRSKSMQRADEIVESVLKAYVSSSEETIFGNCFFEPIAIAASGGSKSLTEGIDLEIRDKVNNKVFCIAVKSGTSVFNADSKKRQEENFNKAKKLASQGKMGYEPVVGYGYGQKKSTSSVNKSYEEVAGEDFWTMLTGDPDFYKKIIVFMGNLPEKYVETFNKSYAEAFNRLVCDFTNYFCNKDGSINWNGIIEFNSASLDRLKLEKEEECKIEIISLIKDNSKVSMRGIFDKLNYPKSFIDKIIKSLVEEKKLAKIGKECKITQ